MTGTPNIHARRPIGQLGMRCAAELSGPWELANGLRRVV